MNYKRIIAAVMVAAMGMSTTACNETIGTPGGADASSNGAAGIEEVDTQSLDADLDAMEKSMADVESEVSKISLFSLSSAGSVQSKSIDESLDQGIRKLFDGLLTGVDKVKEQAALLRAKVNVNLAKLDPLNPLHIALVMKMQDILKYLDQLDAEISSAIGKVVALVNAKVADIDKAVAKIDPKNPLSVIAMIYWAKLRATIVECNGKLAAKM